MTQFYKFNLKLIKEEGYRYTKTLKTITSSDDMKKFFNNIDLQIETWHNEKFGIVLLDTQNNIIGFDILFDGTIDQSAIYIREIINRIVLSNAKNVVLFHNHPAGTQKPSPQDITVTKKIKEVCKMIEVTVLDHIIITVDHDDDYINTTSMAELGVL
jgi:DNA repair protein RadC